MLTKTKKEKLEELIYTYASNRSQMGSIDTMDHDDSLYLKAAGIGVLIGWGFFMGIGIHLCNIT